MALPNPFRLAGPLLFLTLSIVSTPAQEPKVPGMTEADRLARCENNRARITEIEARLQQLQPMGQSVARQITDDIADLTDFLKESWLGPMQLAKVSEISYRYGFDPRACLDSGEPMDACLKQLDTHISEWADERRAEDRERDDLLKQLRSHQTNIVALYCNDATTPTAATLDPSGDWVTTFGDMSLSYNVDHYEGRYTYGGGRIDAKMNGDRLVGYWISPTGTERACEEKKYGTEYYGRFEFTFSSSARFTGIWGYCNDPPGEGKWDGGRPTN
jgi:hypothetical protein